MAMWSHDFLKLECHQFGNSIDHFPSKRPQPAKSVPISQLMKMPHIVAALKPEVNLCLQLFAAMFDPVDQRVFTFPRFGHMVRVFFEGFLSQVGF